MIGTTTCVAHVRAWTLLLVHAPPNTTQRLTYYVDPSFCAHVLPQFHEDRILSFRTLDCASVRAYVRAGFDAWQHNAHVSFQEVDVAEDVDVVVDGRALNEDANATTGTTLAQVRLTRDRKARLTVDADACWYVDSAFCHAFSAHATLVQILLASAWLAAVGAVAWLVCRPVAPYGGTVRLVAWALLIAPPLVYWGALTPCLECHDFGATVAHEVGHVLGLGHPDDATRLNRCGCGDAATPCAYASSSSPPIMHSVARSRGRACLQRDDVDGARTRYGGNCSAPVWCYEEASYAGFARFAVALVYAFAAAWLAVSVRVCAWRWWHKKKRTHVLQPPQRHSSSLSKGARTQRSHRSHHR